MTIFPYPRPSGPTGAPGRRLGAGLGESPSIQARSKRLENDCVPRGGALHSHSQSPPMETSEGQMGNVGWTISSLVKRRIHRCERALKA